MERRAFLSLAGKKGAVFGHHPLHFEPGQTIRYLPCAAGLLLLAGGDYAFSQGGGALGRNQQRFSHTSSTEVNVFNLGQHRSALLRPGAFIPALVDRGNAVEISVRGRDILVLK
jgi:hypothetical protein